MKKTLLFILCFILPLGAAAQQNWKAVMRYDKQGIKSKLFERLEKYVVYDTQAGTDASSTPSSKGQLVFAKALAKELKHAGAEGVQVSKTGVVTANIPAVGAEGAPVIALIGHLDTHASGKAQNVKPIIHSKYTGGDIIINQEKNLRLSEYTPQLLAAHGHDLMTSSDHVPLGADGKAGIAVIMTLADVLLGNPSIAHGPLKIVFIPDALNGNGAGTAASSLGADYAYVISGPNFGEISAENFSVRDFSVLFGGSRGMEAGQAVHSAFADNLLMMSDFHTLLPRHFRPETTSGRRGFIWVSDMQHKGDQSLLRGQIRAFTPQEYEELSSQVTKAFNTVKAMFPKHTAAELTFTNRTQNAKDAIPPQMLTRLQNAMQNEEIKPVFAVRRTAQDAAARLTADGLPSVVVFSGAFNSGTELEYADADVMEASLRALITLTNTWTDPKSAD